MDGFSFHLPAFIAFLSSPLCALSTNSKYWVLVEIITNILLKRITRQLERNVQMHAEVDTLQEVSV
jgi:hypothetical protein